MAYGNLKADNLIYDDNGTDTVVPLETVAGKAPLASPTFTGNVDLTGAVTTGVTQTADDDSTKLATTAYVQTELGDYAPLASPTFTGTITGDLTGDVTGNASGTAATVTGAAQTNITSVGQLTAIDIDGPYTQVAEALGALAIDCGTGNYFTKTIDGDSTFTVSNVPASKSYSFVLELTHTSGTVTWFSGVEWPAATAPTLTTGKTHLFVFHTDNGGTRWRASSLVDYTN